MTKVEKDRQFKEDLARYLKDYFAKYRQAAEDANDAYHRACMREGTNRPQNTSEWDALKVDKNNLQHQIERKLPQPGLFKGVYTYYNKLVERGTINNPIQDEDVLALIAEKGPHIGSIKPVGTYFREVKNPESIYQISGIKDNKVLFYKLSTGKDYVMSAGNFQNKIKDGVIEYAEFNKGVQLEFELGM